MWRRITVDANGNAKEENLISFYFENNKYNCTTFNNTTMIGCCETISDEVLKQRIKQLNRRVNFPVDAVREIMLNEQPVSCDWGADTSDGQRVLKLKYRDATSRLPFHIEWHLKRMETADTWMAILMPLLQTVNELYGLVVHLQKCVRDKDVEIKQYKVEGSILRRSTVATKPFDATLFDELHKETSMKMQGYENFSTYLAQSSPMLGATRLNGTATPTTPQKNHIKIENCNENLPAKKESPRNRKRKAVEFGKVHLERKVIQRRQAQQLLYKDSQSQGDSQDEELACKLIIGEAEEGEAEENEIPKPDTSSVSMKSEKCSKELASDNFTNSMHISETKAKGSNTKSTSPKAAAMKKSDKSASPEARDNDNVANVSLEEQGLSGNLIYETSTDESFSTETPKVGAKKNSKLLEPQSEVSKKKTTENDESTTSKQTGKEKRDQSPASAAIVIAESRSNQDHELADSLVYDTSTDESLADELPETSRKKKPSDSTAGESQRNQHLTDFTQELREIKQYLAELSQLRSSYESL